MSIIIFMLLALGMLACSFVCLGAAIGWVNASPEEKEEIRRSSGR